MYIYIYFNGHYLFAHFFPGEWLGQPRRPIVTMAQRFSPHLFENPKSTITWRGWNTYLFLQVFGVSDLADTKHRPGNAIFCQHVAEEILQSSSPSSTPPATVAAAAATTAAAATLTQSHKGFAA